ncbi:hypothetical protein PISMIDRAFT_196852 [Pisolithus microcarpus 441]|uniref:Unplaced genomic scaffold scaffold_127, whole genome shotgun sequence n=1 Tax=Pisolithus microcarpus 441 TaxID=765257 RepID=A0A0C9YN72_9AGAM|nr:hypothetical protein PISMIDRAFT_196852 [Pisolithus microcarpus 441]
MARENRLGASKGLTGKSQHWGICDLLGWGTRYRVLHSAHREAKIQLRPWAIGIRYAGCMLQETEEDTLLRHPGSGNTLNNLCVFPALGEHLSNDILSESSL